KGTEQAIQEAIQALVGQGRDVTTAAVLYSLQQVGIKAKSSDLHASAAWKEQVAKEKSGSAKLVETKEIPVAKAQQKPKFPSKPCPNCGELIHARSLKHEKCGWVATAGAPTGAPIAKKLGRPKGVTPSAVGSI